MNLKNLAFGIICFLGFSCFAQTEKSVKFEGDSSVCHLKIETDSYKELSEFKWESIYDIFESNDPDDIINLQIGFNEKLELGSTDIEEWSITLSGKTSELGSMVERAENILKKLHEI